MRQIFSVRFFAAIGAVAGLFFLLTSVFATRAAIDDGGGDAGDAGDVVIERRIDLVDRVQEVRAARIVFDADGFTIGRTELVLDATRTVTLVSGTPGEVHCAPATPGDCALVVDLLGEGVVWFALVPAGASATAVQLPAIDVLADGLATLVNGWQVRFAPVLDRRCTGPDGEDEFASYRELRDVLGDDFVSVFDLAEQRLTAVVCRERVPYAPVPSSSDTTTASDTGADPDEG